MAAALLLLAAALASPTQPCHAAGDESRVGSFEDRRELEKSARSRFRRLELASLVLIVVGAGAAAWWTLRKK